ncbi:MAG TPA: class I SAM-dependent methyltransferase [Allosphingosinicella sp.]|jgi:SAM-dependent methyltransferase
MAWSRFRYKAPPLCYPRLVRAFPLLLLLAAGGCAFGGSGMDPFAPAPATRIAEADLDVPYVPTPRRVVEAMLELAEVGRDDYLIDLGSGDGRIAIMAAQRGARAFGVDLDPARVSEATAAAALAQVGSRARFRTQDLFDTPLREASVVTMYLLPEVNMRLRPRLLTELRPGTRIVSHNFDLGDWRPDARREFDASRIFLWIVPATAAGRWILRRGDGSEAVLELEQQFQTVTGTLGGRPLENVALRGRSLRFTVGRETFRALVEDSAIVPDPAAPPGAASGWRARRG